jgi:hypothetical protein
VYRLRYLAMTLDGRAAQSGLFPLRETDPSRAFQGLVRHR